MGPRMTDSSKDSKKDGLNLMGALLAALIAILLFHYISVILTPKYSRSEVQTFRQGLLGDVWKDFYGSRLVFIGKNVYYYGNNADESLTICLNVNFKNCLIHSKDGSDVSSLEDYLERRRDVKGDKPIILKGDYEIEPQNPFSSGRAIRQEFEVVITWSSIDKLYDFEPPARPISSRTWRHVMYGDEVENSTPYTVMDYFFGYADYKTPILNDVHKDLDDLSPQFVKSAVASSVFKDIVP